MRSPTRLRAGRQSNELQMAPLIDCVFLLLTYFLFTISLATIEGVLPSELALGDELQQQRTEQPEEKKEVVVRMAQTGERVQYFVDDWPVGSFADVLRHLSELPHDSTVVIDAGATVTYRHVVRLYNQCLKLEVERVVFPLTSVATSPAGAPRR